ncbi:MAG: hypothetical protein V4620_02945 [Bacteroidota bacterium]
MKSNKIIKYLSGILLSFISLVLLIFAIIAALLLIDFLLGIFKLISIGYDIQHTLVSHFNINENTATSIITSVLIFASGLLVTWVTSLIREISHRYRYRKMFIKLCFTLSKSVLKKSYLFQEFAETLDVKIKENFTLKDMALTHFDNINKIDMLQFHAAFFKGIENLNRRKEHYTAFDSIYASISNIKRAEELYTTQLEKFMIRYNYLEEKRNDAIVEVKKIIDKLGDDANGKKVPIELPHEYQKYLAGISQIIANWNILDNNTLPSVFDEHFIQKIKQHNLVFQEVTRVRKLIPNDLYYSLNDAENEYKSIVILVNTHHEIFKSYSASYEERAKKIFNSICVLADNKTT